MPGVAVCVLDLELGHQRLGLRDGGAVVDPRRSVVGQFVRRSSVEQDRAAGHHVAEVVRTVDGVEILARLERLHVALHRGEVDRGAHARGPPVPTAILDLPCELSHRPLHLRDRGQKPQRHLRVADGVLRVRVFCGWCRGSGGVHLSDAQATEADPVSAAGMVEPASGAQVVGHHASPFFSRYS